MSCRLDKNKVGPYLFIIKTRLLVNQGFKRKDWGYKEINKRIDK